MNKKDEGIELWRLLEKYYTKSFLNNQTL
jgi:hypothetical protein